MERFRGQEEKHIKKKEMHPVLFAVKEVIRKGRDIWWLLEPNNNWRGKQKWNLRKNKRNDSPKEILKLLRSGFFTNTDPIVNVIGNSSEDNNTKLLKNIKITQIWEENIGIYHSKILRIIR